MSKFSLPKEVKAKVLSEVKKINRYDLRILYLLKNLGPQRFTDLIEYAGLSRSTVSKYLKNHEKRNIIEKKLFKNQITNRQEQRYFITELGIEMLNEEQIDTSETFYFNELNSYISQLSDLVNFYKEIGVADSIIYQILKITSKVGENFFILEKDKDFYLTLFYIFLNSVSTRDFKFEINEFCKHYDVKRLRIDFYVDKIMSNNLGYYIFTRGDDIFFFHADDIIGTTTLRLIKDRLIKEIIHINLDGYRKIYDLDKMAEKIAENLMKMNLIWEADEDAKIGGIREPFEMLIEKMIIKTALDMGFSRPFLMDMILQSEKMRKAKRGVNSLIDIIEGSERYEDLNLVSISEFKSLDMDEILEQIQGFCPNCGKTILKKDLSTICSKCSKGLEKTELIRDINEANKVSMRFKQIKLKEEEIIECPNPNCNYYVKSSWDVCPECSTRITKEGTNEIHRNVRSIANNREQIKRSMDIKKLKNLASNGALGQLDIEKAQVGSNGYGFVFFDFHPGKVNRLFWKASSKVCGAGAHFGDFEKFMALDDVKFDKLSDVGGLMRDIKHDLLLAGSLKTLLPDMEFGGDEMLFDVLMFVMTPNDQFFPATFYYGPSGTSLGGWDLEGYKRFPKEIRDEFNFSPFDLDKDGLTGLIEAQIFALQKVPVSDFCGIYKHDLGDSLMCVHDGVAFLMELGYDYEYGEDEVEIVLNYLGYDFEIDKFNFREMVKKSLELFDLIRKNLKGSGGGPGG